VQLLDYGLYGSDPYIRARRLDSFPIADNRDGILYLGVAFYACFSALSRTAAVLMHRFKAVYSSDKMAIELERLRGQTSELEENQRRLALIYDTVRDVIFQLAVEPDSQFRFVSVNAAFLKVTGLSREAVVGRTVNKVIPEPSLTVVLEKYRLAIEGKTRVLWEETSDYPTGRFTGEIGVTPVFDNAGERTHLANEPMHQ
jgi:PAS domain S-box-containing protein